MPRPMHLALAFESACCARTPLTARIRQSLLSCGRCQVVCPVVPYFRPPPLEAEDICLAKVSADGNGCSQRSLASSHTHAAKPSNSQGLGITSVLVQHRAILKYLSWSQPQNRIRYLNTYWSDIKIFISEEYSGFASQQRCSVVVSSTP